MPQTSSTVTSPLISTLVCESHALILVLSVVCLISSKLAHSLVVYVVRLAKCVRAQTAVFKLHK